MFVGECGGGGWYADKGGWYADKGGDASVRWGGGVGVFGSFSHGRGDLPFHWCGIEAGIGLGYRCGL